VIPTRFLDVRTVTNAVLLIFLFAMIPHPLVAQELSGQLRVSIKDAANGKIVPARLEVRGSDGEYRVAEDALPVGGDCTMSDPPPGYIDEVASVAFSGRVSVSNPYTRSTQFYSVGRSSLRLPPGPATIKVYKGPEYEVSVATIEIKSGATTEQEIELTRWINMPQQGWYSGDDHLHIARPTADLNPSISKMMQAEDVHVANLLQMGKVENFSIAQQYAHGPDSYYQEGNYILAAGQENPRTHFLGHTITLGAEKTHFNADQYLVYRLIWQETVKEGAINGFAHAIFPYGSFIAPHDGLAVVLPHNLLHFLEVLQFDRTGYDVWYDLLALGFRITPTAGTDYPCGGQFLPGHERFYTKVEGPLTYAKWIESVRKGRTFVTTGPIVEFRLNGQDIGSEIELETQSDVEISGSVTFDPQRDDMNFLELLQNGNVIERFSRVKGSSKIEFAVKQRVEEASWFAVRGYGVRTDENPFATPLIFSTFEPTSTVHSAPIFVSIRNYPGLEKSTRGRDVARAFLARLNDLERVLATDNTDYLSAKLELPDLDAVPKEIFLKNRQRLLQEIEVAKAFFRKKVEK